MIVRADTPSSRAARSAAGRRKSTKAARDGGAASTAALGAGAAGCGH